MTEWLLILFMNGYAVQIPTDSEAQCQQAAEYVEQQIEDDFSFDIVYACVPGKTVGLKLTD